MTIYRWEGRSRIQLLRAVGQMCCWLCPMRSHRVTDRPTCAESSRFMELEADGLSGFALLVFFIVGGFVTGISITLVR